MKKLILILAFTGFLGCAPGQVLNAKTGVIATSYDCMKDPACAAPIYATMVAAYEAGEKATPPVTPWAPIAGGIVFSTLALIAGLWTHYKESQAQRVIATTQILNAIATPPPPDIPAVADIKP